MRQERIISGLMLLVGLALALLGQVYLCYRRLYVRDGILLWGLAVVLFGWLALRLSRLRTRRGADETQLSAASKPVDWRLVLAITGAGVTVLAGLVAVRLPAESDFTAVFVLWLAGVFGFLTAFVQMPRNLFMQLRGWCAALYSKRDVLQVGGLIALLVVAFLARAVDLEHIPPNLSGDEGTWGLEGLAMLTDGLANPFGTRWFSFPSLSFLAWGLSMRIFGETVAGLRMLSALIGTATVLTTFLFVNELWDRRTAWLAAFLLAFEHYHLHFSRLALNNIADGLLATLALWLLARGLRTERPIDLVCAGTVIGAGWYGYFGARLLGLIAVVYVFWLVFVARIKRRVIFSSELLLSKRQVRLLLLVPIAALVVVAPLLIHYVAHPAEFNARVKQVSIFASGWLAREQQITGRSAASLLLQQFWRSVTAFYYTLDPSFAYHATIPLLDCISAVFFLFGMVWAVRYIRRSANILLLVWFWLALVLGWTLTENPPSSARLVIVTPALAIFTSLGVWWITDVAQGLVGGTRHWWEGVAGGIATVVAVLNLHYYFAIYTPMRIYGNPTAETATELARYLVSRDDHAVVYFHGPPFIYWDFGTLRFIARGVTGFDVPPIGEGETPLPDPGQDLRFVFLPERLSEMTEVQVRYPGGVVRYQYSSADGRLLYAVYEVLSP